MEMEKEFLPWKLTCDVLELGCKPNVLFGYFNKLSFDDNWHLSTNVSSTAENHREAILWQQAEEFFREAFGITVDIYRNDDAEGREGWDFDIVVPDESGFAETEFEMPMYESYEEARLGSFELVVEAIKNREIEIKNN